ncbi:hypothetical protein D3C84_119300 [compost metagenome]
MNDLADLAPRRRNLQTGRSFRKVASLLILSLTACCASTAAVAQATLRAHWVQKIEEEATFVGVLSRAEDEDIRYVDLHLELFSNGVSLGTEVHRIELAETVELFSLPVEEGIDCFQVESVVGVDSDGFEVPGEAAQSDGSGECIFKGPHYF